MVRVLCFSDLHRDRNAAAELVKRARSADVVVGAGDFANRHEGLSDTLEILSEITIPAILVPGNGETAQALRHAASGWKSAVTLHGQGHRLEHAEGSWNVWGVGGGIPVTPFGDWSYDFDEATAADLLSGCPFNGLLVTHSPPLDTVDHDGSGQIRGSQSIRDCVIRCQPQLVVCGHIHSDWGRQERLGNSLIVNAGPQGVLVSIE